MEDANKYSVYRELHKRIKGEGNFEPDAFEEELSLLKLDLESSDPTVQNAAISIVKELLIVNDAKVRDYVFSLLENKGSPSFRGMFHALKIYFKELVCQNKFDIDHVYQKWIVHDNKKILLVIKEMYENDLSPAQQKDFLLNKIIEVMLSPPLKDNARDAALELAYSLLEFSSIMELTPKELGIFMSQVSSRYVDNISNLRDGNYENWHKLWIFLIRYFNKKLHNSMSLTNKLLRIVEYAFRNPSVQQRIKGYDCWKELIDNASLDQSHLSSPKQIKLLVTPLKAKFSKQETVICKRFEVFTYLLEKLQENLTLVLQEFLEFCFGFTDKDGPNNKGGQAKVVPEICLPSIAAFMEIIGHSHESLCLKSAILKLAKPVINSATVEPFYQIILHSATESCILLENYDTERKDDILKCLWRSIFKIILNAEENLKILCFSMLPYKFEIFVKKKEKYYEDLLAIIFSELVSCDMQLLKEILPRLISFLSKIFFTAPFLSIKATDNFIKLVTSDIPLQRIMIQNFSKVSDCNFKRISKLWKSLLHDLVPEHLEDIKFLLFPLRHNETISMLDIETYKEKLIDLEMSERLYGLLLKELETLFKENPLLSSEIVKILNIIGIRGNSNNVIAVFKLLSSMLVLPDKDHNLISQIVCAFYIQNTTNIENDDEIIKSASVCIERLLHSKDIKIMEAFEKYISNADENIRKKYSKHLYNILLDFNTSDSNSEISKVISKILPLLHFTSESNISEKSFKTPKLGRSAKIAKLVQTTDIISPKISTESPLTLKLFGKDLDTPSPIKIKGSQLKNATPPRSKKIMKLASLKPPTSPQSFINEEKSSDFVPIDSEVKIDKHKLTEKQKEALKKRREDIPALYQDLSQSTQEFTTDSTSNSNSTSNRQEKEEKTVVSEKDSNDESKCLVEETEKLVDSVIPETEEIEGTVIPESENIENQSNNEINASDISLNNSDQLIPDIKTHVEETPNTPNKEAGASNIPNQNKEEAPNTPNPNQEEAPNFQNLNKEEAPNNTNPNCEVIDIKEQKRRLRMEQELRKLSMDIVGADEYISRSSKRKRIQKELSQTDDLSQNETKLRRNTIGTPKELSQDVSPAINKSSEDENRRKTLENVENQKAVPETNSTPIVSKIPEKTVESSKRKSKKKDNNNESTPVSQTKEKSTKKTPVSKQNVETPEIGTPSQEKAKRTKRKTKSIEEMDSGTKQKKVSSPINKKPKKELLISVEKNPIVEETKVDESSDTSFTQNESVQIEISQNDKVSENKGSKQKEIQNTQDSENMEMHVDSNVKQTSKRGRKRKRPVETDFDDEDIIESSQESFTMMSRRNSSAQKSESDKALSIPQKGESEYSSEKDKTLVDKDITFVEEKGVNNVERADKIKEKISDGGLLENKAIQETPMLEESVIETHESQSQENKLREETPIILEESKLEIHETQTQENKLQEETPMLEESRIETHETQTQGNKLLEETPMLEESKFESQKTQNEEKIVENNQIHEKSTNKEIEKQEIIEKIVSLEKPTAPTQQTQHKRTQSQDTQTQESNVSPLDVEYHIQLDIPKKPEFTDSERQIAEMDTLSFTGSTDIVISQPSSVMSQLNIPQTQKSEISSSESVEDKSQVTQIEAEPSIRSPDITSTPPSSKSSIQSSPVTVETPNRTTELLNDTLDISPINSQTNDEDCVTSTSKEDFVSFKAEPVELEDVEEKLEVEDDFNIEPPKDFKHLTERSCRLLNMVQVDSPLSLMHRNKAIPKRKGTMSPSLARIKKLMAIIKPVNSENIPENIAEEDILTFKREVPSPLAVPKSSILKRKLSDSSTDDIVSPCAKRKRVNFCDPCTTSKKVFIKDEYYSEKPILEGRCLFDVSKNIEGKDLKDLFDVDSESENIETEKSLEVENPLILRKNTHIYPELIDCKDDVVHILKKLTSPMFVPTLLSRLKTNNIKSVGDLARESETTIARYPFKVPILSNVYKVLDHYYNKVYKVKAENEAKSVNDSNAESVSSESHTDLMQLDSNDDDSGENDNENEIEVVKPVRDFNIVIVDAVKSTKDELRDILKRVQNEKIPFEDITEIFIQSLNEDSLLDITKKALNSSKISIKDIVSESHFQGVLKHFIETHGLPKVFEHLTEIVETSEDESIYFDCMIKHSIEKRPLSALLEKRSLVEIRNGLTECIDQNMFAREDLLEICLMPLIKAPEDLYSYFNKLSLVQLANICVNRAKGDDFKQFVILILKSAEKSTLTAAVGQLGIIKYFEKYEITEALVKKCTPKDIIECFKQCVKCYSSDGADYILYEMFKFASSKLSMTTLTELHIDFLRKIPKMLKDE